LEFANLNSNPLVSSLPQTTALGAEARFLVRKNNAPSSRIQRATGSADPLVTDLAEESA